MDLKEKLNEIILKDGNTIEDLKNIIYDDEYMKKIYNDRYNKFKTNVSDINVEECLHTLFIILLLFYGKKIVNLDIYNNKLKTDKNISSMISSFLIRLHKESQLYENKYKTFISYTLDKFVVSDLSRFDDVGEITGIFVLSNLNNIDKIKDYIHYFIYKNRDIDSKIAKKVTNRIIQKLYANKNILDDRCIEYFNYLLNKYILD